MTDFSTSTGEVLRDRIMLGRVFLDQQHKRVEVRGCGVGSDKQNENPLGSEANEGNQSAALFMALDRIARVDPATFQNSHLYNCAPLG